MRRHIFEPFITTKGEAGTGLGLWVSSEILHKHDGSLRLYSCVGPHRTGTVFRIFLPHRAAAESNVPLETAAAA
jgi:C4-dicarboxylate-specific signal transduction histidine kinase